MNYQQFPSEANQLNEVARVIALPQAYADTQTLETITEQENIIAGDIEEITDNVIGHFCHSEVMPSCMFF